MATTVTKTVKSSGGDYTSLSAWEAGEQGNLVALDEIRQAECYAFSDTTAVDINGWTTDATRYARVFAASGAEAKLPYNTSTAYRLEPADGVNPLSINEQYVRSERIQIRLTHSAGGIRRAIYIGALGAVATEIFVDGCVMRGACSGTTGQFEGLRSDLTDATSILIVRNTVAYDFFAGSSNTANYGYGFIPTTSNSPVMYFYNNAAIGCLQGFYQRSGVIFRNCLADGQGVVGFGSAPSVGFDTANTNASSNYNVSDKADAPGANSRNNQTTTYEDEAGDNFHLASGDASAKDFGENLSGVTYGFTVDFDNVTRAGTWDIGPDEFVQAGGGGPTLWAQGMV
jgi:hypothetical protein